MHDDLLVIGSTLFTLGLLLLITRILGRRTLSELTFYDFVIGLIIGQIGGSMITDPEFSLRKGTVGLVVATLWILALNLLSLKSIPARKLIEAEPLMVIHKGNILEDNLKKRYYNVNDLLEMLREQGTFNPQEVELAIIESDGQLSILKKQEYQPVTGKDLNLSGQPLSTSSYLTGKELIINGKFIEQNLTRIGLTTEQLNQQLTTLGITNVAEITLAMITPDGKLYFDKKRDPIS